MDNMVDTPLEAAPQVELPVEKPNARPVLRAIRYLFARVVAIVLTIVIGIFITVVAANHQGAVDRNQELKVDNAIREYGYQQAIFGSPAAADILETLKQCLRHQEGLDLPFLPRHLLWTSKALMMDWGLVADSRFFPGGMQTRAGRFTNYQDSRNILLSALPNSLLLSGSAYLILFLIGIPLALYLSQREGHWLDRLIASLTPLSSVPSWVIGVLLVMIFAAQLKWLPAAKMQGPIPPTNFLEKIQSVGPHLILPVTAIVLSLLFQLVYNWRTYLMIYSFEDHVELAKAKGLKPGPLSRRYILQPSLPYMLTSFALTLVGFWQTITALEYFFDWPGIGRLYVNALPNFRGEAMYPGEMSLVIGIMVLFAYLLGATVFILDILYMIVDPRLRFGGQGQNVQMERSARLSATGRVETISGWIHSFRHPKVSKVSPVQRIIVADRNRFSLAGWWAGLRMDWAAFQPTLRQIRQSPAAILGILLVFLLVAGSIVIMIAFPYQTYGREWSYRTLTGNPTVPKLAQPVWVNWFRRNDLPSTIIMDSREGAPKTVEHLSDQMDRATFEFTFDFPYREFPQELVIYFESIYQEKMPFISYTWITPDGREFSPAEGAVDLSTTYNMNDALNPRRILEEYPQWNAWFEPSGNYPTPALYLLFADPASDKPVALPGQYTLRVDAYLFEEDSDLEAQFVLFGQVEGWGGTDNLRRDLLVPLLWGLPFALLIGLTGAVITTVVSLITAAAAVWFGGWADALVQRLVEANIILPVVAIAVLLFALYNLNLWLILIVIMLFAPFGTPTKIMRAAFLQVKESPYIEAARAYGTTNWRIIRHYMTPRILPVIVPQLVVLIPYFVFLEATLAIFNINDPRYPTWGRVIYNALRYGAAYGSRFWVLEPIGLMLLTGMAFVLLGFSLNRILNPRLRLD